MLRNLPGHRLYPVTKSKKMLILIKSDKKFSALNRKIDVVSET